MSQAMNRMTATIHSAWMANPSPKKSKTSNRAKRMSSQIRPFRKIQVNTSGSYPKSEDPHVPR